METVAKSPEDVVYARAARLLAVRDAVADVFGGNKVATTDPNDLREIVTSVRRAIAAVDGAYGVIIGGLAVQNLGYVRWTEDVDVVVDAEHYRDVLNELRSNGFTLKSDGSLEKTDTGAKLDFLKEGVVLHDSILPLPHPSELGPNRGFATLAGLTRLKLDTNRAKDTADVVELFKRQLDEIETVQKSIPPQLLKKYDEWTTQARREARK